MNKNSVAILEYDTAGQEITRTHGNGLITNMTCRNDHLLIGINNPAVGNCNRKYTILGLTNTAELYYYTSYSLSTT